MNDVGKKRKRQQLISYAEQVSGVSYVLPRDVLFLDVVLTGRHFC